MSITHALVQENQEHTALTLANVKFAASRLGTKLGDHPVSLGTDSVYKILEELVEDARALEQHVQHLASPEVESAHHNKLKATIGTTMVKHICPLVGLYQCLSSSPLTAGDLIKERLQRLESQVPLSGTLPPLSF